MGIVFQICHYWDIWKVVNGHSFVLIRQMAPLVSALDVSGSLPKQTEKNRGALANPGLSAKRL